MAVFRTFVLCGLLAGPSAVAAGKRSNAVAEVTPLQKLTQMLDDLVSKGKKEKQEEEVEFTKYQVWCTEVFEDKAKSIEEAAAQIEDLTADIAKAKSDAVRLAEEVEELEGKVATAEEDLSSAQKVRDKERKDYEAEHLDLSESIDACERAIQTLNARSADVPQSLLQVQRSARVPEQAKQLFQSYLDLHEGSAGEAEAPEANAYEFQSGGVVGMLEKLASKFKEEKMALEKAEMNAKANHEMLKQQLEDDLKQDKATISAKRARRARRLEDAATAKSDLAATVETKANDEKVLSDTKGECRARSQEYEKNQVSRAGEVKALEKALEILNSGEVKGSAEEHLPSAALLQVRRKAGRALVQLAAGEALDSGVRRQTVAFLQDRARATSSRYLSLAASWAAADPFVKVRKMVQDLIMKLQEEETAEAEQHSYCTSELDVNKHTRETKTEEVEELTAMIEQLTSTSERLTVEIRELSEAIAGIKNEQNEASKIREEEKKANTKAIADAQAAQKAVEKATKVLRDYYDNAAAASLLQSGNEGQMSQELGQEMNMAVSAPYQGQQSSSTGVFGMLDVVLSDFARLETETQTAEDTAANAHAEFMNEAETNIGVKEADIENKENKKQITDEKNRNSQKELKLTQEELDKAKEYHDKLKAECVDTGLSYEDKKAAREEEIQTLQDALKILDQKSS